MHFVLVKWHVGHTWSYVIENYFARQLEHAHNIVTMTTWTPGILEITSKMAEKHTISVIGLLKDAEFHMAKGAAEVLLDIETRNVKVQMRYNSGEMVQDFQLICCFCLWHQQLSQRKPEVFTEPYVLGLLECDWDAFIRDKKKVWQLVGNRSR